MEFTSPLFLFLFLPIFMAVYYVADKRGKLLAGLAASLVFYSWGNIIYVPLMVVIIVMAYFLGRKGMDTRGKRQGLIFLWVGIIANAGILVTFKLLNNIQYPLGLSYISFQVISYLLEIHNQKIEAETDFIRFSFYVLLFPKILVGPITRYSTLKDQINELQVTADDVAGGIRRFIVGAAKKILIADTLAKVVSPIFALNSADFSPATAWLVLASYALQLFFDFSGYTDMAIGLGRMMGLRFVENFNFPYMAKSISDFWRRWHISLSSWFRDFVFYPLERNKPRWLGQAFSILIVFLLTGLWHGIAWSYVIWGLLHGLALVFENSAPGRRFRSLWAPIQHTYALSVILIGWVFFRSPTLKFALEYLRRLAGSTNNLEKLSFTLTSPLPIIEPTFVLALVLAIMFCFPLTQWATDNGASKLISKKPSLQLPLQITVDLFLLLIFIFSVAAVASELYVPNIYGKF